MFKTILGLNVQCELCGKEERETERLCRSCGEMIARLVRISLQPADWLPNADMAPSSVPHPSASGNFAMKAAVGAEKQPEAPKESFMRRLFKPIDDGWGEVY